MKKLLTLLSAVVISGSIMAQKPSSDDSNYSLEGMINYDGTNGINWNAPNLRMRYFVNDNIAVRLTLGMESTSETTNVYEADPGTGTGTIDVSDMEWSLGLGAEYHLSGTDKLSPYFSAGLSFGGTSMNGEGVNTDGTDYVLDMSGSSNSSSSTLGIGLGAGIDYYVADNIYLGVEMGFGWMSESDKGGSMTYTLPGAEPETMDTPAGGSDSSMDIGGASLGFRIGWRF
tara:strand:+ start:28804 stop:29490 length:687 start_codon:yes stop_codon:yes gene_type:complete